MSSSSDGYVYGEPLGPQVVDVHAQDDFTLTLLFSNGERRLFDAKGLMEFPVFEPLSNISFFKMARAEDGAVVWPRDLDLCADTLYPESILL